MVSSVPYPAIREGPLPVRLECKKIPVHISPFATDEAKRSTYNKMPVDLKNYREERQRLIDRMARGSVDEVLQWYDECAHLYNDNFDAFDFYYHKTTTEATLEYVKDKNAVILDIGAGTGKAGELLKKYGYTTIDAIDGSHAMLDIAMKKNIYRRLMCSTIGTEPLPNLEKGSYDVLIAAAVFANGAVSFESVPLLMNYLKKGGFLIFSSSEVVEDASLRLVNNVLDRFSEEWEKRNICSMVSTRETFHANNEPAVVYTFTKL